VKKRHSRDHDAAPGAEDAREDSGERRPSKSQLKREMTELQDLGERLLKLQPSKLRALPIPPELLEAVELAQRINSREGLRRQRQYIGRLMRAVDSQPLRAALDGDGAQHRAEVALMHAAEHWRERLLTETDALAMLRQRYEAAGALPESEWSLAIEQARAEKARGQPGRHFRELYRMLREALAPAPTPKTPAPTP
jgi:ribosome-associated protein